VSATETYTFGANTVTLKKDWITTLGGLGIPFQAVPEFSDAAILSAPSIYQFKALDIQNREIPMTLFHEHVMLIVNVASNDRGFTDVNYRQLQELYMRLQTRGFTVLAFPCDQFGQEPGTAAEINTFTKQYNVTFPLFAKVRVNGKDAHPIFKVRPIQRAIQLLHTACSLDEMRV